MTDPDLPYIGRFAPSPTGPLHVGSMVAAVGSYLESRVRRGKWLLRIDDVDAARVVPGATSSILSTLERFGFEWDDEVVYQSKRHAVYAAAFERLKTGGNVYPCACSRRELVDSALTRDGARRYPGTCRNGLAEGRSARAWRVRAEGVVRFVDVLQGEQVEDMTREVGDYVLLRADGLFAYQLAVVVDDADAGVTHIVRGADLLFSTGRQIFLQHLLNYPQPQYGHLPVATNEAGEKLSKQTLAAPVDAMRAQATIVQVLRFLGQNPPQQLGSASLEEVWNWAKTHWKLQTVPRRQHIAISGKNVCT